MNSRTLYITKDTLRLPDEFGVWLGFADVNGRLLPDCLAVNVSRETAPLNTQSSVEQSLVLRVVGSPNI